MNDNMPNIGCDAPGTAIEGGAPIPQMIPIPELSNNLVMKKYQVKSLNDCYFIMADNWSVGADGLKFYQNKEIVAWFTTWDYWMLEGASE